MSICTSKQKFIKLLKKNNIEINQNYDFKKFKEKLILFIKRTFKRLSRFICKLKFKI